MSLGLPSVRPTQKENVAVEIEAGKYGARDLMTHGLKTSEKSAALQTHPLEYSETHIGRLPCMATKTHNLMYDTLTGQDEMISFDDIFNNPQEFPERSGQPHAMMEKRLGIL